MTKNSKPYLEHILSVYTGEQGLAATGITTLEHQTARSDVPASLSLFAPLPFALPWGLIGVRAKLDFAMQPCFSGTPPTCTLRKMPRNPSGG